jgi:hypothetical protein
LEIWLPPPEYRVRIEFTPALEPSQFFEGMPYVSLLTEIEANSLTSRAAELREERGRIPYSSPLYWWESRCTNDEVVCEYIGQTIRLPLQKRFETHAKVSRLLAKYVNDPENQVMFRLCSRLDVSFGDNRYAIEHLPPAQAAEVVADVEARLIFERQPPFNTHYKLKPKVPWKPFVIETFHFEWPPVEQP